MDRLYGDVHNNIELYRSGAFDKLVEDGTNYIELDLEYDQEHLGPLDHYKEDGQSTDNLQEVEACIAVFRSFESLTPYLARDSRLWTYLTHQRLLVYSRARWPIPHNQEAAVKHIRAHFFANTARGVERDNAVSRLWWMAYLCSRANGITLDDALRTLLLQFDVRANILERPTTSQSINVFSAILRQLQSSYYGERELFVRKRFRAAIKQINLLGGTILLPSLRDEDVDDLVAKCFRQ
jgi:hypothetical protein